MNSSETLKWFAIRATAAIPVVVLLIVVCEGARDQARLDAAERRPLRYRKSICTPVGERDSPVKVIFETGTVTFETCKEAPPLADAAVDKANELRTKILDLKKSFFTRSPIRQYGRIPFFFQFAASSHSPLLVHENPLPSSSAPSTSLPVSPQYAACAIMDRP